MKLYSADLSLPGPYLEARSTTTFDSSKDAPISVGKTGYEAHVNFKYPISTFAAMHLSAFRHTNLAGSSIRWLLLHQPWAWRLSSHSCQRVGTRSACESQMGRSICRPLLQWLHSSMESDSTYLRLCRTWDCFHDQRLACPDPFSAS